jgi:hypothetical protein
MDYGKLPERLQYGARRWIEHGIYPGDFLTAVIENNLTEAFSRADDGNTLHMVDIVKWWYNEAPGLCWGSKERCASWAEARAAERKQKELADG